MKVAQFTTSIDTQSQAADIRGRQVPREVHQVPQIKKNMTEQEIRKEDVKLAAENMNDFLEPVATHLKFVYHEDLNDYYVTVVDPLTNEVVREIPPKKMLDMYVAMAEYMGLLVDEKV